MQSIHCFDCWTYPIFNRIKYHRRYTLITDEPPLALPVNHSYAYKMFAFSVSFPNVTQPAWCSARYCIWFSHWQLCTYRAFWWNETIQAFYLYEPECIILSWYGINGSIIYHLHRWFAMKEPMIFAGNNRNKCFFSIFYLLVYTVDLQVNASVGGYFDVKYQNISRSRIHIFRFIFLWIVSFIRAKVLWGCTCNSAIQTRPVPWIVVLSDLSTKFLSLEIALMDIYLAIRF